LDFINLTEVLDKDDKTDKPPLVIETAEGWSSPAQ